MNCVDLRIDKRSTWHLIPGLIALVLILLFIVQSLSSSASAQKELAMTAVVTKPIKRVSGSLRDLQATTANVLVNNPATDQNPGKTQSNATIVRGSGMNLISSYNDSGSRLLGNRFIGYSRSTDMGATWSDLGSWPFDNAGLPVLASHDATGRIYLSALPFAGPGILVSRTTDLGSTWAATTQISPGPSGTSDRPWIAVDNFAGTGNGNLYLSFNNPATGGGILFARSTDFGSTFTSPRVLADNGSFNVNGAFVTVGPDHSVHVFWLAQSTVAGSPNIIQEQRTTDSGATFGPTNTVVTLNTTGTNGSLGNVGGFRTNSFPQAAVNPVSGDIYVVYNDINAPTPTDRGDIYLQQSTDGGVTWAARLKVNTDLSNHLNWQPTLAVPPDGTRIMVAWYDRRNDPNDSLIEYFGRVGSISGSTITFGPDFAISDSSFPAVFGQDSLVEPTYMGDYDQMSADNNSFYTVWGDNRLSSAPDVRFAQICTGLSQCPANIVVSNDPGQCGAIVSYAGPGCGTLVLPCSPRSGTLFPVGITTVTCTTTAGPSCSFSVTVNDTQPPAITCPANLTAVAPPGSSGGVVNFPAPAVSDNCPGVTTNCVPPSGSTFPLGTTTVTCTATDASGNTATCSFTVSTFNICLQDESTPSTVLLWNSQTGEYRFCCKGTVFTGFGQASSRGNIFTLQAYPPSRRIVAKVDESVHRGTASLLVLGTGMFCSITDFNTLNNSCQCP